MSDRSKMRGSRLLSIVVLAVAVAAALLAGFLVRGCIGGEAAAPSAAPTEAKVEDWTCSMHPQIRKKQPGQCPICGMDLIPVGTADEGGKLGARQIKMSQTAQKLAQLRTARVQRRYGEVEVRLVGKIGYDETRVAYITSWVPGRIDRLYVDYTGITVKEGDHMVYLYSPELIAAQSELLQAIKSLKQLRGSDLKVVRETAEATVKAAREKLRLWGLKPEQIEQIEKREEPLDHLTIYAPQGGIVVEKHAFEGMYVKTGMRIYTVADLSQVWAKLDAYESDLPWLRYGQKVQFETKAYPGVVFEGRISFISPVLDENSRSVKVRVNVPNQEGRLKPEMLVHATVKAKVAAEGKVMSRDMVGKWICPMHPEQIKEEAGKCEVCGMPLVRAESLGYVAEERDSLPPLIIPDTAPLITGRRAVVYVKVPGREGVFEGREVVLGPRAGDRFIVRRGLKEGDEVVTYGAFKLDSALQILAKPSMMSPEAGRVAMPDEDHAHHADRHPAALTQMDKDRIPKSFLQQLDPVYTAYFGIRNQLSKDTLDDVPGLAANLLRSAEKADMKLLEGKAHEAWMGELKSIRKSAKMLQEAQKLDKAREGFLLLSESMIGIARHFGTSGDLQVIQYHCPMAFGDRGADWLQSIEGVQNPYFGGMMFKCGEKVKVYSEGRSVRAGSKPEGEKDEQ